MLAMKEVALPVSLAEHEARIHRVKVPFHFPACSLEGHRDSQYTLPCCPFTPSLQQHFSMKGTETSHLFNEEPRMAGTPQQRWLLQSVFKYGLQGRTERPSHQVCHPFCDRVISSNGVLMNTENQLSADCSWSSSQLIPALHSQVRPIFLSLLCSCWLLQKVPVLVPWDVLGHQHLCA